MIKLLLTFATFAILLCAAAQPKKEEALRDLLKTHTAEDTFRVNQLAEICELSPRIPVADMERFSTEGLRISQKIGYKEGEVRSLLSMARVKYATGDNDGGLAFAGKADSIATKLDNSRLKIQVLLQYSVGYTNFDFNKAFVVLRTADSIATEINDEILLRRVKSALSQTYYFEGDFARALEYATVALKILEKGNCLSCEVNVWNHLSNIYIAIGQYDKSTACLSKAIEANKILGSVEAIGTLSNSIGENYRLTGKYKEAMQAYREALAATKDPYTLETVESNMADVYLKMDSLSLAFEYAFRSLALCEKIDDQVGVAWIHGILSRAYMKKDMPDSALFHATKGLETAQSIGSLEYLRDNAKGLADAYLRKNDFKQAYYYQNQFITYRDSMLSSEVKNKVAVLEYNTELEKKQGEIGVLNQQKKAQQNFLIAISLVLLSILVTAIALLRNNRMKQKANTKIEKAYAELKSTQAQLVQSEKMASLGELTAGIAHEIQNPLNFVTNFSEINKDLLVELNEEAARGNLEEVQAIAKNVITNEEKINHHGKRADSIVKGMLQHSRNSTGQKELTNINTLTEEYIRLAYHGLRARDKSFNAVLETDFASNLGKLQIVRQDLGRALLNLVNNAFYAVNEKARKNGTGYEPTVSVATKKAGDKIQIKVADNGGGIPHSVIDKIFQPFFTTKPPGQGTGLGLSLTYDIIKAHGGELKVESTEGEGTSFSIYLPYS